MLKFDPKTAPRRLYSKGEIFVKPKNNDYEKMQNMI